ncbi:MAG: hypothetical protein BWX79_01430 [Alphaproteobacteria bacterium ADurb.Bin100]|nr:MAG: hypothetical protein BWX79_01430 [Alphaproteobacteria bacterium ADurb.Bin100]
MGAPAKLTAGSDVEHAHGLAVFLAEQHHGAGLLRRLDVHHARLGRHVHHDFGVDAQLDLADLDVGERRVVREVETGALGIDQRALLLHMAAQHFAQRLVHQVGDRVVSHGRTAHQGVDPGGHMVAHVQRALGKRAMVAEHVGLDLLRICHVETRRTAEQFALVAHLAAALGVERRGVEHDDPVLPGSQLSHADAVKVQRDDLGGPFFQVLIAGEGVAGAAVLQRLVHLELAGCTALGLLLFHGGGKTGAVHLDAMFAAHVRRQIKREAVGVVQLEGHVAGQDLGATGQRLVQNLHPGGQGFEETLFLDPQHLGDAGLLRGKVGVGRAHEPHQVFHELVEKRRLLAQLVAMADGAAHDAALHVAPAFVGGNHAVADEERGGADVVGNHLERRVAQVGDASFPGSRLDQHVEQVDLVVAVHVLQDGGQALQAHAGVHAGRGQWRDRAVFLHVELHEHVVPDLDEAVAIFVGASRRAAGNVVAVVIEDFTARAAGAGVGHHPEVVGLVAPALVVTDADHTLRRQADLLGPDVVGLVVLFIHRGQQALGGELVDHGQQFPGPLERFALEVVAEAPVTQHLEERMVARGVTHVLQVVVLAAGAQAGLYRGGAHIRALVSAQEHVLELHHARVGEHQRRVVARHQRARRHDRVALGGKEVEEALADISDGESGSAHCFGWFAVPASRREPHVKA